MTLTSKKGSALIDGVLIVGVLFTMSLFLLFITPILTDFNQGIQEDSTIAQVAKDQSTYVSTNYPKWWDNAFITIFALLWILTVIASFFLDTHPIFFVVSIVGLTFLFVAAAILGNVFQEISIDPDYQSTTDNYPKMNFIMTHLLEMLIVMVATILIALYGKARSGGGALF